MMDARDSVNSPTTTHRLRTRVQLEPDEDLVVLLDEHRQPIGSAPRRSVHTSNTPLHLAFSSYIFAPGGQVLLTRRALAKGTWPGVWTNSCCGHPRPGEALSDAVRRRVQEELGMQVGKLHEALPDFAYQAVDASGVLEHEVCPVFVTVMDTEQPEPDVAEVDLYTWVAWDDVVHVARRTPNLISPWAAEQISLLDRWLRHSALGLV